MSFELRAQSFSSILQNRNIVFLRYRTNLIDLCRHAIKMDGNNRFRFLTRLRHPIFYGFFQKNRAHIPSILFTVYKYRRSPQIGNRISGSAESESLTDHLVTGLYTQLYQCQVDGSRTGRQGHHFFIFNNKAFKLLLESVHIGTKRNYPVGIKGFFYETLFLTAHVGEAKINTFIHKIM